MNKDWEEELYNLIMESTSKNAKEAFKELKELISKNLAKQRTQLLKEVRELIENKWDKEFIMNSQYQSYELFILKKLERLADESK